MSRAALVPTSAAGTGSRLILNLGCGIKSSHECVNIDWSWWLRVARNPIMKAVAPLILDSAGLETLKQIALQPILLHDLRKGIPFPDSSVDAVYHSHVIEHIDRASVTGFVQEIRRVLKPNGIQRIVAPDFEALAKCYLADFTVEPERARWQEHDERIANMIEQMVRRESAATWGLKPVRRKLDVLVRGDARQRGETHQWMYDRINLPGLLAASGFREICILDYRTSGIPGWDAIGLDLASDGRQEYKPGSLYVECTK